jgi:hypothetical protein
MAQKSERSQYRVFTLRVTFISFCLILSQINSIFIYLIFDLINTMYSTYTQCYNSKWNGERAWDEPWCGFLLWFVCSLFVPYLSVERAALAERTGTATKIRSALISKEFWKPTLIGGRKLPPMSSDNHRKQLWPIKWLTDRTASDRMDYGLWSI